MAKKEKMRFDADQSLDVSQGSKVFIVPDEPMVGTILAEENCGKSKMPKGAANEQNKQNQNLPKQNKTSSKNDEDESLDFTLGSKTFEIPDAVMAKQILADDEEVANVGGKMNKLCLPSSLSGSVKLGSNMSSITSAAGSDKSSTIMCGSASRLRSGPDSAVSTFDYYSAMSSVGTTSPSALTSGINSGGKIDTITAVASNQTQNLQRSKSGDAERKKSADKSAIAKRRVNSRSSVDKNHVKAKSSSRVKPAKSSSLSNQVAGKKSSLTIKTSAKKSVERIKSGDNLKSKTAARR